MIQNEHAYAICCRPEEAGDVISGENVKNIESYGFSNLKLLALVVSEILKTRSPPIAGAGKTPRH